MPVKAASAGSLQSKPSIAARSLRVALALGSVGAFAWVFAYAYIEGTAEGGTHTAPLLRADTSPIKTGPPSPAVFASPIATRKSTSA